MTTIRKNIMLGTAGHVDHGKTALVKLLTGCDTDTLSEEKQRGLTIDLGFAPCRMSDERIVGIVDVPGHVGFVRNMVAGAHGIDVVILVVAADDGVMPQTREHLDILTLMGVRHGVVALTKVDLVDPVMRELAVEEVRKLVAGTFLERAPICGISNITGEGFEGFFESLNGAVNACRPRESTGLFRAWIEDVFSLHGFGTVVTGIPTRGEVRVGDRLRLLPGDRVGRVRRMQVYGEEAQVGLAGECVAINLADVEPGDLSRGKVLCAGEPLEPVSMLEAQLRLLPGAARALKDYAEVHLHVGTAEVMARVALLEDAKLLHPGEQQMVQLRLARPVGVAAGERFVIRHGMSGPDGGLLTTIGGGRILGTSDIKLRRGRPWTLESLARRRDALDSPAQWCAVILREANQPLTPAELARRAQMPASQVEPLLAGLRAEGTIIDAPGGAVAHRQAVSLLAGKVVEALQAFHKADPARLGMEEADLLAQTAGDKGLLELALATLAAEGAVLRHGAIAALPGRGADISLEDQRLCQQIEAAYLAGQWAGPTVPELAASLGEPPERVFPMVRLLADQGRLVQLGEGIVMHSQAVEAGRAVVVGLFGRLEAFTTMEFRDALGVSRKYAVPLLDYFDRTRLTVRLGNRRKPGAEARRRLQGPT